MNPESLGCSQTFSISAFKTRTNFLVNRIELCVRLFPCFGKAVYQINGYHDLCTRGVFLVHVLCVGWSCQQKRSGNDEHCKNEQQAFSERYEHTVRL